MADWLELTDGAALVAGAGGIGGAVALGLTRAGARLVVVDLDEPRLDAWDTGFHWGEWLEPGDDMSGSFDEFAGRDKSDVATAYYARSAGLMSRIAAVIGRASDAGRYARLASSVRASWQAEFIGPDAALRPATQATFVRALTFGLLPDHLRARAAARLVRLIRDAGRTWAPASSPPPACCPRWPTPAMLMSPMSCCFRTRTRRGCR